MSDGPRRLDARGHDTNPVIKDFFSSWTNEALGQLKLWLEDEIHFPAPAAGGDGLKFGGSGQVYGDQNTGDYLSVDTDSIRPAGGWDQGWSFAFRSTYTAVDVPGEGGGFYILMESGQIINILAQGTPPDGSVQILIGADTDVEIDSGTDMTFLSGNDLILDVARYLKFKGLPTSAAGLPTKTVWNNGGVLTIT